MDFYSRSLNDPAPEEHPPTPAAASSPLYFCSLCSKPFGQESSHSRHVQYCQRRAARKQPARQKACLQCRKAKTKCDFSTPCSRCVARRATCSYETERSGNEHDRQAQARATHVGPHALQWPTPDVGLMATDDDIFGQVSGLAATTPTLSSEEYDAILPLLQPLSPPATSLGYVTSGEGASSFELGIRQAPRAPVDQEATVLARAPPADVPPRTATTTTVSTSSHEQPHGTAPEDAPTHSLIIRPHLPEGARRFIMSVIRTYPRKMTRPDDLPPYVHLLGSSLHFDDRDDTEGLRLSNMSSPHRGESGSGAVAGLRTPTGAFAPLGPLAACHGVAQIYAASRTDAADFLWRTVDNEQRRIEEEMHRYSPGETLAALQAMATYGTMRLGDSWPQRPPEMRNMMTTMGRLSRQFSQKCPGPFRPVDVRAFRPSWPDWIFDETRRRTLVLCFLLALATGDKQHNLVYEGHLCPLPSARALWEARDPWTWEREYDACWELRDKAAAARAIQLETLGDLAHAHALRDGAARERGRSWGPVDDEVMDGFHAGLDGLGTMLAAVAAGA